MPRNYQPKPHIKHTKLTSRTIGLASVRGNNHVMLLNIDIILVLGGELLLVHGGQSFFEKSRQESFTKRWLSR